jgi:hypothetical protein
MTDTSARINFHSLSIHLNPQAILDFFTTKTTALTKKSQIQVTKHPLHTQTMPSSFFSNRLVEYLPALSNQTPVQREQKKAADAKAHEQRRAEIIAKGQRVVDARERQRPASQRTSVDSTGSRRS